MPRPLSLTPAFRGIREAVRSRYPETLTCDRCGEQVDPKGWSVHRSQLCGGKPAHIHHEGIMGVHEETDQVIAQVEALAQRHAALTHRESELEAERPLAKLEAIRRVMVMQNGLTGKAHSYSSAEAQVETDAEYSAYLKVQRNVVLEKGLTWANLEAARLRARLGIAVLGGVA